MWMVLPPSPSHGLGLVAAFPLFGDGFGDGFGEASALPASRSLSFQYPNVASLVMTSSKPSSRSSRSAAGVAALGGEGASRGAAFAGVESDADGRVRVDPESGVTSHPSVYAAGDCVDGDDDATVVQVVAQANRVAAAMIARL